MNLNNFEHDMDEIIFERGLDYYEYDYILSLEAKGDHVHEAVVKGTELYKVKVELDEQGNIVEILCDCPYDMGPYCKHQAAVLLALREKCQISVDTDLVSSSHPAYTTSESSDTETNDSVEAILLERTKEELVAFLLNIANDYDEVKQRIGLNFDITNDEEDIKKSISLIRTYINKNADRYGFVTYRNTIEAVIGADLVLDKAKLVLEQNKSLHALDLTLCVIKEMMDLLEKADDSDGTVGEVLYASFGFIHELVQNNSLQQSLKEKLFNKLTQEAYNKRYDGWTDWRVELLESCSVLAVTPALRNQLEKDMNTMVENEKDNSGGGSYFIEQVHLIKYSLLLQHEGEATALEYIKQHLQYSSFRKIAIETAMSNQDYGQVIRLALEGESQDKSLRGLVQDWKEYRYKAYKLSDQLEKQRELATDFILQGNYDYYSELKHTYDSEAWDAIYPKILKQLETERFVNEQVYPRILIEEGELQKLLEYVQERPSRIEIYYKHLLSPFKNETYALFLRHIRQNAALVSNRRGYQQVCAMIRRLKKAGGKEEVTVIIQELYTKYANRPAFRDELTKV